MVNRTVPQIPLIHTYTVRMDRIRVKYVPFAARVHPAYTTGL